MEKEIGMEGGRERSGNLISVHERLMDTEKRMQELKSMSECLLRKFTRELVEEEMNKPGQQEPHQTLVGLFDSVNGRISYSMDETAMNINRVMEMID